MCYVALFDFMVLHASRKELKDTTSLQKQCSPIKLNVALGETNQLLTTLIKPAITHSTAAYRYHANSYTDIRYNRFLMSEQKI